jgi:pantothenate kinase
MQECGDLVLELREKAARLASGTQLWIGLAGAPGSGKSTLAKMLKAQLGKLLVVIPQDGYHYYRSELDAMDNPSLAHIRRGAPFTFNSKRLVNDLKKARIEGNGVFPSFDHCAGDPIEAEAHLYKSHRIVLVEGNYLLLDREPWCQLHEKVFDETWFLNIPLQECEQRVKQRHIELGMTEEQARLRVKTNDALNAELIAKVSPGNANRMINIGKPTVVGLST